MEAYKLVFLSLFLTGCATKGLIISKDTYESECIVKVGEKTSKVISSSFSGQSQKTIDYWKPSLIISGINNAEIIDHNLRFEIHDIGRFDEYEIPYMNTVTETHYVGKPENGIVLSLASVGIYPIISPRSFYNLTFGCTEITSSVQADISKQNKTGRVEWKTLPFRKTPLKHKISISGFEDNHYYEFVNKCYPELSQCEKDDNIYIINLSSIMGKSHKKSSSIKLTCLDCNLSNNSDTNPYKKLYSSIDLDFNLLTNSEKNLDTFNNDSNLDHFNTCQRIGFEVGSKKFKNCLVRFNN